MMVNSLLIDVLCLPNEKGNKDMQEIWKPIPGFEGLYDASSFGRIRSTPGKVTSNARYPVRVWKTRVLKTKCPKSAKRHDLRVTLWKDGRSSDYLVARLVASAWHGVPNESMTVNHKDGNYLNNCPDNLEWVTLTDNIKHGFSTGLYSSIQIPVVLTSSSGYETCFHSMAEVDRFVGKTVGYTSNRLAKGKRTIISFTGEIYSVNCKRKAGEQSAK